MRDESMVAVITGAASGIGGGLARVALERGMRVILADRDEGRLNAFAATLSGDFIVCATDVTCPEQVERLATLSFDHFGRVDKLFNNAGVLVGGKSWEIPADRWNWVMQVNIMGIVHGVASFLPKMVATDRPCQIINTASVGGFLASPLLAPYSASKFAVVSMTEALAVELQIEGYKVSAALLAPGPVRTDIFRETTRMTSDEHISATVGQMRDYTYGEGIDPEELARRAFAGIDAGHFWLIPQPEVLDDMYRDRLEKLFARETPQRATYNV